MLIYHPVHDINHCVYRLLRLLEFSKHEMFPWDQLRLLDFYSVFPHLLKEIKPFPSELSAYKKLLKPIPDSYESIPNDKRVFHEMMPIQNTAIHNMVAKNLIRADEFKKNLVARTKEKLPGILLEKMSNDSMVKQEWFRFLIDELPLVSFSGKSGLKSRSDLMEFRYDGN